MIFCSVAQVDVSDIDVVCASNRLGEANEMIVISECFLDGQESNFC